MLVTKRKIIGATHEDALLASRYVMKRALSEIAYYCKEGESASQIAFDALIEQEEIYKVGVMRAVD